MAGLFRGLCQRHSFGFYLQNKGAEYAKTGWFFDRRALTTTALPENNSPDNEDLVMQKLKLLASYTRISMQSPLTDAKYAHSRAQLIPDFFLGKLQLELLEYPELPTNDEVTATTDMFNYMEDIMLSIDSSRIDGQGFIEDSTLARMRELGLFGQRVSPKYGGLGMTAVESARISEAMGLDASIFTTLLAHECLGVECIKLAGTEDQKLKYLPSLTSGKKICAFCLSEATSSSSAQEVQGTSSLSSDSTHYILNAEKFWVCNGSRADIFIVFARTTTPSQAKEKQDGLTAFIVERDFGGIHPGEQIDKMGLRGLDFTNVSFLNVPVPFENVLGQLGDGFQLASSVPASGHYLIGAFCVGLVRNVLSAITEHCLARHQLGRQLADLGMVQNRLALAVSHLYALESMTYHVAGLISAQDSRDLTVEAAVVKLFAIEVTRYVLEQCMELTGVWGITKKLPLERYIRDIHSISPLMGSNDLLRLFIGGSCISYAGRHMQDFARKVRRPRENVLFSLRQYFTKEFSLLLSSPAVGATEFMKNERGSRVSLQVCDHLHHNLRELANELSRMVKKTHEFARQGLITYGNTIDDQQLYLKKYADLAMYLFAITSCLSRASRAKSIGVRYADRELELTTTFALMAFERMNSEFTKFRDKDNFSNRISSLIYKEKGYPISHALFRVW